MRGQASAEAAAAEQQSLTLQSPSYVIKGGQQARLNSEDRYFKYAVATSSSNDEHIP